MNSRIEFRTVAPKLFQAGLGLEGAISSAGLDVALLDLVRLRASQINGCAYCLDMHAKDLRARGETEQRVYSLDAWAETPYYTDRERAALAWTEAVTRLTDRSVPDDVYEAARQQFSEAEMVTLTFAVAAINFWNRLSISFRSLPGGYQPAHAHAAPPKS